MKISYKHIFCIGPSKLTKIDQIKLYKQLISDKDWSLCSPKPQIYQNKLMILDTLPTPFAIKMFDAKQNILLHNVIFSLRGFVTRSVIICLCLMLMNRKPDTVQQRD